MKDNQPSETYKKLYYEIIDELFVQICSSNLNYCIKDQVDGLPVPMAIWYKFESNRVKALENMTGSRLDRHKLASCICGAILEVRPITGFEGAAIVKKANEIFALCVGLNVIKAYMLEDLLNSLDVEPSEKRDIHLYIKESFDMQFPENICDHQGYEENFTNALYWCRRQCHKFKISCFQYDMWAYSKLFYHLELYNRACIRQKFDEYRNLSAFG